MKYRENYTKEENELLDVMGWWDVKLDPAFSSETPKKIIDNLSERLTPEEKSKRKQHILNYLKSLIRLKEDDVLEIDKRFGNLWLSLKYSIVKDFNIWDRKKKDLEKECIKRLKELANSENYTKEVREQIQECLEFCWFIVDMEE